MREHRAELSAHKRTHTNAKQRRLQYTAQRRSYSSADISAAKAISIISELKFVVFAPFTY